ncbi:MAG: ribosomal protein S18-alanine N-acetyltransferase [Desulfobacterales bacterium]
MEGDLILDHAAEADINALLAAERLCFSRPWGIVSFTAELAAETGYNCTARENREPPDDRIAAYLFFRVIAGEMEILRIAVLPDWRRQGVGRQILGMGLQKALAAGAQVCFLEVRASNIPAMALYADMGFRCIGQRPGYYAETGEDALILMKNLKEGLCVSKSVSTVSEELDGWCSALP